MKFLKFFVKIAPKAKKLVVILWRAYVDGHEAGLWTEGYTLPKPKPIVGIIDTTIIRPGRLTTHTILLEMKRGV